MRLLFAWGFDVGSFVDRVELAALDGVEKDFGGFLDAFEEAVVFCAAGCGFLVGVMAEDLLAVGALDLVFCCAVAVFGEAEDGVVVLALFKQYM